MSSYAQPWIYSRRFDLTWILAPAFVASALMFLLPPTAVTRMQELPVWVWVICVMGIDVAHVYSTLYRTYFDPDERQRYATLLWVIPLACWIVGVLLYSQSAGAFWTVLAYLAVYHFIRQQYGFTMIYSRREPGGPAKSLDRAFAYAGPLYALVYWHSTLPRQFHWFVEGDFVVPVSEGIATASWWLFCAIATAHVLKECASWRNTKRINVPKNAFLWGSTVAWYVGIVHFNADLPFTVTNVVSHGIPYIGLIWAFGNKKWNASFEAAGTAPPIARAYRLRWVPVFIAVLLILAFIEEGLWDRMVWREHAGVFGAFNFLPDLSGAAVLALVVPLLAIPQMTHYVLDAFIWRVRRPDPGFQGLLEQGRHP